ncbi:MAG: hypothetical protein RHS_3311 [Robinsoniella sp. RHS]|nr:MAG: hypothetical protein RHS_3311 [Robinsoniella sp. RHS]
MVKNNCRKNITIIQRTIINYLRQLVETLNHIAGLLCCGLAD